MTHRLHAAALLLATLAVSGCASTTAPTAADAPVQREYRTGSNIPIRDATPLTKAERERQAEAGRTLIHNSQQGGFTGKP